MMGQDDMIILDGSGGQEHYLPPRSFETICLTRILHMLGITIHLVTDTVYFLSLENILFVE